MLLKQNSKGIFTAISCHNNLSSTHHPPFISRATATTYHHEICSDMPSFQNKLTPDQMLHISICFSKRLLQFYFHSKTETSCLSSRYVVLGPALAVFMFIYIEKCVCVCVRVCQGQTYPLGKGRWLLWAPKSQGPPIKFFIYKMRIKHRHAKVYYHDNHLRVQVERSSCVSCL